MKIQALIEKKLMDDFSPVYQLVLNESGNHNVPAGSETHFKVILVAAAFEGRHRVQRHRLVNKSLASWMSNPIHALSLELFTEEEWLKAGEKSQFGSPRCQGGMLAQK